MPEAEIRARRSSAWRIMLTPAAFLATLAGPAQSRVTKIVIDTRLSPAFNGASFGSGGQYEMLAGRAFGELDPNDPHRARHGRICGLVPAGESDRYDA